MKMPNGKISRAAVAVVLLGVSVLAAAGRAGHAGSRGQGHGPARYPGFPVAQVVGPANPQAVVPGGAFRPRVFGANFTSSSVVNRNRQPRAATFVSGQDRAPRSYGKANKEEIHAYVMLIRLRYDLYGRWKATGKWPDDAEANRALDAHSDYWQGQLGAGRAILAGGMNGEYWDNMALIIFEAGSQSEAESIVANDPAVKAYVFQAQVRRFDIQWVTNKFDLQAPPPK